MLCRAAIKAFLRFCPNVLPRPQASGHYMARRAAQGQPTQMIISPSKAMGSIIKARRIRDKIIFLQCNPFDMFFEYIQAAISKAVYEVIDDEEPYYGEVPDLRGVWATGKTQEECRENLRMAIEDWIAFSLRFNLPIPVIEGQTIKAPVEA